MGEDRVRHQGCESDNTSQATPTRESDNRKARVRQQKGASQTTRNARVRQQGTCDEGEGEVGGHNFQ